MSFTKGSFFAQKMSKNLFALLRSEKNPNHASLLKTHAILKSDQRTLFLARGKRFAPLIHAQETFAMPTGRHSFAQQSFLDSNFRLLSINPPIWTLEETGVLSFYAQLAEVESEDLHVEFEAERLVVRFLLPPGACFPDIFDDPGLSIEQEEDIVTIRLLLPEVEPEGFYVEFESGRLLVRSTMKRSIDRTALRPSSSRRTASTSSFDRSTLSIDENEGVVTIAAEMPGLASDDFTAEVAKNRLVLRFMSQTT